MMDEDLRKSKSEIEHTPVLACMCHAVRTIRRRSSLLVFGLHTALSGVNTGVYIVY